MCGITGWVSTRPERFASSEPAILSAMQRAIGHRGPDGRGAHIDPPRKGRALGAALGFTRLAIRDLSHGAQPMLGGQAGARRRRVVATLNGELYDEARLTDALRAAGYPPRGRCDAELLAHGAAAWGDTVWPRLEGMYAAVVWRPEEATLTLARDSAGQKPLYVALLDDGRTAAWGSEIGALLAHPALRPRLDPRGVDALLWLDYVPAPGSLLRGVYKLPPGAVWTLSAEPSGLLRLRTSDVATLAQQITTTESGRAPRHLRSRSGGRHAFDEAVDALDYRLGQAVRRRMVSDVPVGVFLSGGVDSSLVAHYAARHHAESHGHTSRLPTLSVRFDAPSFDESRFAREVAAHLGTAHREISFDARDAATSLDGLLASADEPLADPSLLVTRHLCRESGLKVALGGDGGDEAWLGYPTFAVHGVADLFGHLPARIRVAAATAGRQLPASDRSIAASEKLRRFLDGVAGPRSLRGLTWIGGLPPDRLGTVHKHFAGSGTTAATAATAVEAAWDEQVGWGPAVVWAEEVADGLHARGLTGLDAERALLTRTYLAEGVLQKVDRASMAHGVEVRAPWLDRDVLALAAALPPELLLGRDGWRLCVGKRVPRALAARLLPATVSRRAKKGFGVPLSAWLRGPLAPRLRHDLRPAALADVPGLRADRVARLLEGHTRRGEDHRKTLFALWRLVAWWRNAVAGR